MEKEMRVIQSFDKINFKDFGTLILTQGEQESLTIQADAELLEVLIAEVRGDTLVLGVEDDWLKRIGKAISSVFNSKDHKVTYYLTFVNLSKISVSGQCHLECDSLSTETLKLNISGMGNLEFNELTCDDLKVNISGRGEFEAVGQATNQHLRISGSGEYNAPHLASQTARITISGQGNVTLRAEEDLNITISGLGQVNYYGRPKIRQVISGMGKSKRLDDDQSSPPNSKGNANDKRDQDREESIRSHSA